MVTARATTAAILVMVVILIFRLLSQQVALKKTLRLFRVYTNEKAGPNQRPGFLEKCELSTEADMSPLPNYLLFTLVAGAGACLLAQAPRVRVAAARATTAAILVMVMEYFASFLCWLLCVKTKAIGSSYKEKTLFFLEGGAHRRFQPRISTGVPS